MVSDFKWCRGKWGWQFPSQDLKDQEATGLHDERRETLASDSLMCMAGRCCLAVQNFEHSTSLSLFFIPKSFLPQGSLGWCTDTRWIKSSTWLRGAPWHCQLYTQQKGEGSTVLSHYKDGWRQRYVWRTQEDCLRKGMPTGPDLPGKVLIGADTLIMDISSLCSEMPTLDNIRTSLHFIKKETNSESMRCLIVITCNK